MHNIKSKPCIDQFYLVDQFFGLKVFFFCINTEKVIKLFAPFPVPIKTAWNNAMNSLRQDRHQLKKQRILSKFGLEQQQN